MDPAPIMPPVEEIFLLLKLLTIFSCIQIFIIAILERSKK
jgi:hypothetical protein